jgi:SAM-dependent methyltransferase
VKRLHCLDPSEAAINVAKRNLQQFDNCRFHVAGIDEMPLDNDSMDFGYCIGVLHAVPDPLAGIRSCAEKLRPGAPLLLYMHYAFDNRPQWFRFLWKAADLFRRAVSRFPGPIKYITSQCIALLVYFPLARSARLAEKWGMNVTHFPLSLYRDKSFYTMRTDALDRFGTRLEKRFTKD